MNKYEITWDEQYHLIKLYDLLRDNGMINDLQIPLHYDSL